VILSRQDLLFVDKQHNSIASIAFRSSRKNTLCNGLCQRFVRLAQLFPIKRLLCLRPGLECASHAGAIRVLNRLTSECDVVRGIACIVLETRTTPMQHPSRVLFFIFGAGAVLAVISAEIAFVGWLWMQSV
jgi:hypothetical protein